MKTAAQRVVWIASFPKSGNTWMRVLLSNLLANGDAPQDINDLFLKSGVAGARARFEDITLLDSHLLRPHEIDVLRPQVHDVFGDQLDEEAFVKTHDAYTYLPDGTPLLGRMARAAIYLVRDPRDVVISLSHFWAQPVEDSIEWLNDAHGSAGSTARQIRQQVNGWSGHAQSWLSQKEVPVRVVRYEDLLADTGAALRDVLQFLGMGATDEEVERAVKHSSFEELKRQEQEKGFREASAAGTTFFREGRAGAWRNILTPAQAGVLESAHASTMRQFGYL